MIETSKGRSRLTGSSSTWPSALARSHLRSWHLQKSTPFSSSDSVLFRRQRRHPDVVVEVAKGPAHLLEREGERKETPHRLVGQFASETLAARRLYLVKGGDERLLELGLRRRRPAGRQSHAACPQIVAARTADGGELGRQPSLHGLGNGSPRAMRPTVTTSWRRRSKVRLSGCVSGSTESRAERSRSPSAALAVNSASDSRPCGVRRAFLWMSIRLSQGTLTSRQHQLPQPEPDGQPIESSHLAR